MARGKDVRNAIRDALEASGAFSDVRMTSPDDFGIPASDLAAAAIEPLSGREVDRWDGSSETGVLVEEKCLVTLLYRSNDPIARDNGAELLLQVLKNAVNGTSLAGLTVPDKTYVDEWRFLAAKHPERRVRAQVSYWYLQGWNDNDETTDC